jgi:hypothetical protein
MTIVLHQRGTVIEKLVEETIRDKSHLLSLLAVCEGMFFLTHSETKTIVPNLW